MLRTALTDLLECSIPVLNAPMGSGHAGSRLAAAVTLAGGVGMVGVSRGASADDVTEQMRQAGPGTGAGLLAWALAEDPAPFDAIVNSGPALVSVAYGDWQPWTARLRAEGLLSATTAGTVAAARAAADAGVDVLVVRGSEGGGHGRNDVATLTLLQEVLNRVDHPCVVAAGGIATGRGLAAVLAAGAAGAWVGTALLTSAEAGTPDAARTAMLAAASTDTAYTRVYDVVTGGWPEEFGGRALRNAAIDRWTGHEGEMDDTTRADVKAGQSVVYAGQGVGLLERPSEAVDVVTGMNTEAEGLLRRWA